MKVFSASQMRYCDNYTIINEPISSIDLMERASSKLYEWLVVHFDKTTRFELFAGYGNNGGDALALGRLLAEGGFLNIKLYLLNFNDNYSQDNIENQQRLRNIVGCDLVLLKNIDELPVIHKDAFVIDGLFGSGLTRPIEGEIAEIINHINESENKVISIDIPSGLFTGSNIVNGGSIIEASYTLSFQLAKLPFFIAECGKFVGDWHLLDIGLSKEFVEKEKADTFYLQKGDVAKLIRQRGKFDHKGNYGHAFLVAGSYQQTGAAILSARACLRAGVGLLTVHVPESAYGIMQAAVPEAMLCIDETELNYCEVQVIQRFSSVGVGPGIGKKTSMKNALAKLIDNVDDAMVLDADALNILAENPELKTMIPKHSILTPHPKEFDRLTKEHKSSEERLESQLKLAKELDCIIVLKGANTCIATSQGDRFFNSTGNPGMATAGSGDVLTGIILSLLAQGYRSVDAALIGVYVHGLAGDIAAENIGEQALIASDVIDCVGFAFEELHT